jgi:hypothetical protein
MYHRFENMSVLSFSFNLRQVPGAISFKRYAPIATRISRKVGCPMAAVIFRTCLFFPSCNFNSIQESGMVFLTLIGGIRSGYFMSMSEAEQGRIVYP